jgi:NAD(P)-dependent dehydrogenase (short-subunit alcohol dehydrogenase family)
MNMLLLLLLLLFLLLLATGRRLLCRGPFSLDGKVVVVTGAGRGLGRQLARRVLRVATSSTLVLLDVDAAALADARAALEAEVRAVNRSSRVLTFECDVADDRCGCCRIHGVGSSSASADRRGAAIGPCASALTPSWRLSRRWRSLCSSITPVRVPWKAASQCETRSDHCVFSHAGVVSGKSLAQLKPAQVRRTFAVNALAHFWTVQSALPSLQRASEALVVSVSSVVRRESSFSSHLSPLRF